MKSRNYNIKQIAENQSVLQIYLYGEIEPSYLNIWGDLVESKTSAEYIRKAIEKAETINGIELYINSIGGYVDEGVSIYNLLKRQSVPVTAYIDGMACSIASVVAMAADKIVMPSNTTMMIHHAIGGCYGNAKEHREFATQLDKISEASTNSYLVHAGNKLTRETLEPLLDAETFLTAEEAFNIGLCDEILDPVDLTESKEIVDDAQQKKNPKAKQAAAELLKMLGTKPKPQTPPEPQAEPKEKDSFEFFEELFKTKNYL
ncbi:MAG: head maturation protease, ClpP-related [Ruminococcus sp.]|jgi:ATP-dependent protease ClpP protease subunit